MVVVVVTLVCVPTVTRTRTECDGNDNDTYVHFSDRRGTDGLEVGSTVHTWDGKTTTTTVYTYSCLGRQWLEYFTKPTMVGNPNNNGRQVLV